jgi:hypothetical protein
MTEHQIHSDILKYLRRILPHGWIVMHVPNGGSRHPIEGARLKALGVVAGWPDISIYGGGHNSGGLAYFMEVKSKAGRVSRCQRIIMDKLQDAGFPVAVVRSIDDARDFVERHSLPSREVRS